MRRCIYTVIMGDYDVPKEPLVRPAGYDFILFTDNANLECPGWISRVVAKCDNPQRKQREIKILAHKYLPEYGLTIYLDGSTQLRRDINYLVQQYFKGGMLLKQHPTRNCVYSEGERVIELNKAPKEAVEAQLSGYRDEGVPTFIGMYETGIMIRENTPAVNAVCEAWWKEVFQTCNRDQISLPVVLWRLKYKPAVVSYQIAHSFIKLFKHRHQEVQQSIERTTVPRIWYLTPFSTDKNIGGEYNAQISKLPDNDWVCIRDGDTIFLSPDNQWGKQIADIVAKHGASYDLIGCITNRLRSTGQLYQNRFSDDHNMLNHGKIAKELFETKYDQVRDHPGPIAGLFLLFPKKTWEKVKFRENCDTFDTHFGKELIRKGGKIGIADGVYLYHWYRAWSNDPLNYKKHLNP